MNIPLAALLSTICIFYCTIANAANYKLEEAGLPRYFNKSNIDDLISVIVIFRHGDRTPIDPYPNDPFKNQSFWPVGFGQLTNRGKLQHYELGQWLRQRYDGFLPMNYSEKDIYIRSTDVDRTLMSAYANLAGLYPPTQWEMWNSDMNWQPIPVHTLPERKDPVLAMKTPCHKYNYYVESLLQSAKFQKINEENKQLYDYLTKHTGKVIDNLQDLEFIYNTLMIESIFNFTLPQWTSSVFPDKMAPLARLSFAIACFNQELSRLKVGPFMNQMSEQLKNSSALLTRRTKRHTPYIEQEHGGPKLVYMYSAHDTTIANILNALNIFEYHSPPYASTILFELHGTNSKDQFVNVFYKNTTHGARLMKLPLCELNCPLDEFMEIIEPISVDLDRWQIECSEITMVKLVPFSTLQNVIIIGSCFIVTLLVTSLIVSIFYTKQTADKKKYHRLPDTENNV